MHAPYDVAIVGFGPCGATAAALLGKHGVRTLVVDRELDVYDKPRAFALDHEIMRVFQGLGITDAVSAHVEPFTPSEYFGADGRLIKRLGSVAQPWPLGWSPNLVFTQPAVERILRQRVAQFGSVEVSLGEELVEFHAAEDTVTLELGTRDGQRRTVRARYLLGCDGASSSVRRGLGVAQEDLQFDEPWLVVDVMLNEAGLAKVPAVSAQYCDPSRPTTYLVGPGAHRRWEIMLLPGEDRALMETPETVWRLLARWIGPQDGTLWRSASYRFHALVAKEWRRDRVFLAGDAAHQQPPFTGQGMCQGVRDAVNLAWKLQLVLRGHAPARLLESYGEERAPHVRRLTTTIKEIGRVIGERDPEAARRRDERLLAEAGGIVKTVPRQHLIPPLREGLLSRRAHAANGTLFPQPRVRSGAGIALLDDVVPDGFLLALRGDVNFDARPSLASGGIPIQVVRFGSGPGTLEETEGVLQSWFASQQCAAALVRPDHYVYGVARDAPEAAALARELDDAMQKEEVLQ